MSIDDNAVEVRAHGWRTLAALHALIESHLESELRKFELSVVEYTVLEVLQRQDVSHLRDQGLHMRMQQLARAVALSPSATTRLVNRLEERGLLGRFLCVDDRRGLYTELTHAGATLLAAAAPAHARALEAALAEARDVPELVELVTAIEDLELAEN